MCVAVVQIVKYKSRQGIDEAGKRENGRGGIEEEFRQSVVKIEVE